MSAEVVAADADGMVDEGRHFAGLAPNIVVKIPMSEPGLEAMSRGAGVLTSVESDRRTARMVKENATTLGFPTVEVISQPVDRVLAQHPRAPYDVVFADPPYPLENAELERVLALLVSHQWLATGSVLVVERSARSVEPAWPEGLVRERLKEYGETVLWYVRAGSDRGTDATTDDDG